MSRNGEVCGLSESICVRSDGIEIGTKEWYDNNKYVNRKWFNFNTSPNQRLNLIILLTVRVQQSMKIVKCSMKGGIL